MELMSSFFWGIVTHCWVIFPGLIFKGCKVYNFLMLEDEIRNCLKMLGPNHPAIEYYIPDK